MNTNTIHLTNTWVLSDMITTYLSNQVNEELIAAQQMAHRSIPFAWSHLHVSIGDHLYWVTIRSTDPIKTGVLSRMIARHLNPNPGPEGGCAIDPAVMDENRGACWEARPVDEIKYEFDLEDASYEVTTSYRGQKRPLDEYDEE